MNLHANADLSMGTLWKFFMNHDNADLAEFTDL